MPDLCSVKYLHCLTIFLHTFLISHAQTGDAVSLLRVDLIRNPQQVYQDGAAVDMSLQEAASGAGKYQFNTVNSRFPSFSWVVQTGYQYSWQILVSGNKELLLKDSADTWNSGKKNGTSNTNIQYSGTTLQPDNIYYWKVRIWTGSNKENHKNPGVWSQIQEFRTGSSLSDFALPDFALIKTVQQPVATKKLEQNNVHYDFGKDGFGQVLISAKAENDNDTLYVHVGETTSPDGHVERHPKGSVRYRLVKVPLKKGQLTYQPVIEADLRNTKKNAVLMPSYIGEVLPFRYVEVTSKPGRFVVHNVTRNIVTNYFDEHAGSFRSSDTTLNKIWELCKYTMKATSFSGYYVDGDRERIPYEGDAVINQLSHYATDAEYNMAKRSLEYLIYHPTWPTEWSLQNILIALNDYQYSGDARLAAKLYDELKIKTLSGLAREDGLISTRTGKQTPALLKSIHYETFDDKQQLRDITDWPQPGETDGFVFKDYNSVVNAFYYAAIDGMAKLANATGNRTDAKFYSGQASKIRQSFQHSFMNAKTKLVLDGEDTDHSSAHANFFALAFGLVPRENISSILAFLHTKGMACSVYGSQFLLDGLFNANDPDFALKLITSNEKRSWNNMLQEGATMTMEAWGQEYKPNQDWGHAWGAAPANAIVRHIAGIQPLKAGFEEVQIKPQPGSIETFELHYATIRGGINVSLKNNVDRFELLLTLPGNTTGQVYLPFSEPKAIVKMDGRLIKPSFNNGFYLVRDVKAGKHQFEVNRRVE